jgi:Spy/CpxP family protein refolding chaperone
MTKTQRIILGLVTSALLATLYYGVVWAQGGAPGAWHGRGHGGGAFGYGHVLKQLNLSPEQQQSVQSIVAAATLQMKSVRAQMHSSMQALQTTMPDDPNYAAVVAQASQQSQQFAATMVQHLSDMRTQIYAVLNADQKAKLPQLLSQMAVQRDQRRLQWQQQHSATPNSN